MDSEYWIMGNFAKFYLSHLMKNTIFNKAFVAGFIMAFVTFVIFNFLTFSIPAETRLRDRIGSGGFPLAIYEWGGEPYVERILVSGIVVDILVGLIYSGLVGIFFGYLRWRDLDKENEGVLVEYKKL
jgi:hypothetical protein